MDSAELQLVRICSRSGGRFEHVQLNYSQSERMYASHTMSEHSLITANPDANHFKGSNWVCGLSVSVSEWGRTGPSLSPSVPTGVITRPSWPWPRLMGKWRLQSASMTLYQKRWKMSKYKVWMRRHKLFKIWKASTLNSYRGHNSIKWIVCLPNVFALAVRASSGEPVANILLVKPGAPRAYLKSDLLEDPRTLPRTWPDIHPTPYNLLSVKLTPNGQYILPTQDNNCTLYNQGPLFIKAN